MIGAEPPLYAGPERRLAPALTEDQIEQIAERAAAKAIERVTREVYVAVGKTIIQKSLYLIGVAAIAFLIWAAQRGWIKP
jgi:hypothetical protein